MMKRNFVESKIQKPSVSSNFIYRKRLVERLKNRDKQLLILHATVGYGKTILLAHYAEETEESCAWYHLSDTDNDIVVFLQYLSAAIKRGLAGFDFDSDAYAPLLQGRETLESMAYDFVFHLTEAARGSHQRAVIILDDFQTIINEEIHYLLQMILDNSPPEIRMMIATRGGTPPFSMRYVVKGAAEIISQSELSFESEEARRLTESFLGAQDKGVLADSIWEKAEGWPAGIMFANLYMKQKRNWPRQSETKDVYDKSVVDTYLMHEIYKNLPYEIQMFLIKTSPLEFLSADICNEVAGIDNARSLLDCLENENLFVIKVGQAERTFRYHSLFKEFLESQLPEETCRETLKRAAEFCLHGSNKEQAVEYALAGRDWSLMQYALEAVGQELLAQGKITTIGRWLTELEGEGVPLTPKNLLLAGSASYRVGRIRKAQICLNQALELFLESMDEAGYIHCMLEKARIARDQVSLEESCRLLESVLPRLHVRHNQLWYTVIGERLHNLIFMGRYKEVLAICSEMILSARQVQNRRAESYFRRFSVIVYFYWGKYRKGLTLYQDLLDWEWFDRDERETFSIRAYVALMYLFTGQRENACKSIREEVDRKTQNHMGEDLWLVYLIQACIFHLSAMGEETPAKEKDKMRQEAARSINMARRYVSAFRENHIFVRSVQVIRELIALEPEGPEFQDEIRRILAGNEKLIPLAEEMMLACLAGGLYDGEEWSKAEQFVRSSLADREMETAFTAYARLMLVLALQREGRREEADAQMREVEAYQEENRLDWGLVPAGKMQELRKFIKEDKSGERRVHIRCFDGFRVFLPDGKAEMKWRTQKAQELFAYLFHLRGKPIERDFLLLQLWPEADKKSATALLHTTLYSIRKTLAQWQMDDLIEYQDKKYTMRVDRVDSDLDRIDELCQSMEKKNNDFIYSRREWLQAYTGSYLEGVAGNFGIDCRDYYERMFLRMSCAIAERAMQEGNFEEGMSFIERAIAVDPYEEKLYLLGFKCFRVLGEVKRAKKYYEKLSRILREELDVEPEEEVTRAYRCCLKEGAQGKRVGRV
ncbi:MAG TPA: BTAD domain-containing putative transcriptional regulator [Bacillota bacterium]|nr:BTAD domain-containing putative transcriptional regulator [Bacillota bacterium]